jgi:hypothetical protein
MFTTDFSIFFPFKTSYHRFNHLCSNVKIISLIILNSHNDVSFTSFCFSANYPISLQLHCYSNSQNCTVKLRVKNFTISTNTSKNLLFTLRGHETTQLQQQTWTYCSAFKGGENFYKHSRRQPKNALSWIRRGWKSRKIDICLLCCGWVIRRVFPSTISFAFPFLVCN